MMPMADSWVLGSTFGMIFCRIMAAIVSLPLLGSHYVPTRLKIALGLMLSLMVFATQGIKTTQEEGQWLSLLSALCMQIMIGLGIGFLVHAFWEIFMMLGDIVSQQSGLSFAHFIDPGSYMGTPILSQFYVLLLNLVFLNCDGHLAIIACIMESFQTIPMDFTCLLNIAVLLDSLSWIFSKALQIAMPSIAALWMVNMAFGIMARVAPQLNIFVIGFTLSLLAALGMVWVMLFFIDGPIDRAFFDTLMAIKTYVGRFPCER
jgi:flagellar biosynthetic protein FliR